MEFLTQQSPGLHNVITHSQPSVSTSYYVIFWQEACKVQWVPIGHLHQGYFVPPHQLQFLLTIASPHVHCTLCKSASRPHCACTTEFMSCIIGMQDHQHDFPPYTSMPYNSSNLVISWQTKKNKQIQATIFCWNAGWLHAILCVAHQRLNSKYARCSRVCTESSTAPQIPVESRRCLSWTVQYHKASHISGEKNILYFCTPVSSQFQLYTHCFGFLFFSLIGCKTLQCYQITSWHHWPHTKAQGGARA